MESRTRPRGLARRGNLGWRYRRQHIAALCLVFDELDRRRMRFPGPFLVCFFFDEDDAGMDALFIYSPNPYDTAFPMCDRSIVWGGPTYAAFIAQLLPDLEQAVREGRTEDGRVFLGAGGS